MPPPSERASVARQGILVPLAFLFAATGATALLAEQAFEKLLSTLVGASTPAAATVLAVYFGGLTLGATLYGVGVRSAGSHPLRLYVAFEGVVAAWALFLYVAFDRLIAFFAPLLAHAAGEFWLLQAGRVAVAACWILPATVPMGASFPAVVDALACLGIPDQGRVMARFYGCNLLGGIAGAFLGPFCIFPRWGLDGALLGAALVNSIVCVGGVVLARAAGPEAWPAAAPNATVVAGPRPGMALLVALAAFSGLLCF